uniref:Uncharacterized protein n=1 Tax=Anguilla anguilla TaxID=7936 RepID=A0A0E9QR87_ANGAN
MCCSCKFSTLIQIRRSGKKPVKKANQPAG